MTYFAGNTADHYFEKPFSFVEAATIFLQVARALREIIHRGFTHNDLKGNNVCVSVESSDPVATVIDFGLATPVGTERFYRKKSRPEKYPWLAPELLMHTHPTSEASDVYSLAGMMEQLLGLEKGCAYHPLVAAMIMWMEDARRPDPAERPNLAALMQVLEALLEEASKASPQGASETDECSDRNEEVYRQEQNSSQHREEIIAGNVSSSLASSRHSPEIDLLPKTVQASLLQWCKSHKVPVLCLAALRKGRKVCTQEKFYGCVDVVEIE